MSAMLLKKPSLLWILTGMASAAILAFSAFLLMQNFHELQSARTWELADLQSRDYQEATLWESRQDMLRQERKLFYGGIGIGVFGLVGTFLAMRRK